MALLLRDNRGAAMVFGIFFAMFMVAVVYAIHGTIETLVYREHVQDAADAAAFSAAVVNARGMNLIVLLNMLMAALLAILIGLRIGETFCYIGIAVCVGLSVPTMGSSMAYAPLFQSYAKMFNTAFKNLKPGIHKGISALHAAGKATSVWVPLGSNLRVIDLVAARYDAVGLAIPARLTLPVEDDDFDVLCKHAGELAGYVVMLPFAVILPDRIEDALASGLGNLAQAGSDWFCGKGGGPPDMNSSEGARGGFARLPKLQSQKDCEAAPVSEPDTAEAKEQQRLCKLAAYEAMVSQPGRDGLMRKGERVCPTDCKQSPRASCPPDNFMDCSEEEAARYDALSVDNTGADRIAHTVDNPYVRAKQEAIVQCRPETEGGSEKNLQGYEWLEQPISRTYFFDRQRRAWTEDESVRSVGEMKYVRNDLKDRHYPCGKGDTRRRIEAGTISDSYEAENSRFLCEGRPVCEEDVLYPGQVQGACGRPPIPPKDYTKFRETTTQVIALIGCHQPIPPRRYQTPPVNLGDEMKNSGDKESTSNATSFRVEKDLFLGGSDFQLRSVVFALNGPSNETERAVALASWGKEADNKTPQVLVAAAGVGARLSVAQAEYYFDWAGIEGADDRQEWMWHMCWRARLRPFRMNHSKADAPKQTDERGFDAEQRQYGGEGLSDAPADKPDCAGKGFCGDVQSGMDLVSGWNEP